MDEWIRIILAMFAGAWLYACGVKHASVIPGEQVLKSFVGAVVDRMGRNGQKPAPPPPRISA